MGFWVLVLGGGDGFCKRVENSLRGERFGDLNSSGFILLRCIIIETTRRKVEVWTLEPPLLILFWGLSFLPEFKLERVVAIANSQLFFHLFFVW